MLRSFSCFYAQKFPHVTHSYSEAAQAARRTRKVAQYLLRNFLPADSDVTCILVSHTQACVKPSRPFQLSNSDLKLSQFFQCKSPLLNNNGPDIQPRPCDYWAFCASRGHFCDPNNVSQIVI